MNADQFTSSMLAGQALECAALVLLAGFTGLGVLVLVVYLHAAVRAS